ncbi:hypothetical protein HAP94_13260 [Acidithiobacillus ferrivorans]|nr:hypothetical protein [Acidithiobacillus ferrivorans]
MEDGNHLMDKSISMRERLSASSILLLEMALLVFAGVLALFALGAASELITHFVFGHSSWGMMQSFDWLLFWAIVAAPIMLIGKVIWKSLRLEYSRILQVRMRKC